MTDQEQESLHDAFLAGMHWRVVPPLNDRLPPWLDGWQVPDVERWEYLSEELRKHESGYDWGYDYLVRGETSRHTTETGKDQNDRPD